jgi:hypothetical protein
MRKCCDELMMCMALLKRFDELRFDGTDEVL